jgi:hypothetical protein
MLARIAILHTTAAGETNCLPLRAQHTPQCYVLMSVGTSGSPTPGTPLAAEAHSHTGLRACQTNSPSLAPDFKFVQSEDMGKGAGVHTLRHKNQGQVLDALYPQNGRFSVHSAKAGPIEITTTQAIDRRITSALGLIFWRR